MSLSSRSKIRDHNSVPSAALISSATIRTLSPCFRTVPSRSAHTQLFADSLGFLFLVFETKGRTAADHLEVSDLPQGCDQFLRQSVRKIFVARIAAFVKQWQHCD